ncbi:MAG: flavodoxin [Chloroflexota bacterium]
MALIYGSTSGTTEHIAGEIEHFWQEQSGEELPVFNIAEVTDLSLLTTFNTLIIGVPTWNIGELQDDWLDVYPDLDVLDFSGKRIALFGIGDQHNYSDNFQDALGILGYKFRACGAELIGFTSIDGYDFEASQGIENGQFMGLAIDDLNQPDLNELRIINWVAQLIALTEVVKR